MNAEIYTERDRIRGLAASEYFIDECKDGMTTKYPVVILDYCGRPVEPPQHFDVVSDKWFVPYVDEEPWHRVEAAPLSASLKAYRRAFSRSTMGPSRYDHEDVWHFYTEDLSLGMSTKFLDLQYQELEAKWLELGGRMDAIKQELDRRDQASTR